MKTNEKSSVDQEYVEKINAELAELFESDVKEFSKNGARAFGHILAKYGIDNPQKWLEEKMREDNGNPDFKPYSYNPNIFAEGQYFPETREIQFKSLKSARKKFLRAHEMAHKITFGFRDKKHHFNMVKKHGFTGSLGFYLDEGVSNMIAEKLSGISFLEKTTLYPSQTLSAWKLAQKIGVEAVYEIAFFDPTSLKNKWKKFDNHRALKRKLAIKLSPFNLLSPIKQYRFRHIFTKNGKTRYVKELLKNIKKAERKSEKITQRIFLKT